MHSLLTFFLSLFIEKVLHTFFIEYLKRKKNMRKMRKVYSKCVFQFNGLEMFLILLVNTIRLFDRQRIW